MATPTKAVQPTADFILARHANGDTFIGVGSNSDFYWDITNHREISVAHIAEWFDLELTDTVTGETLPNPHYHSAIDTYYDDLTKE